MENTSGINVNGTQQNVPVKYCTTCGESLNPMAEICPKCGVRQAMPVAAPVLQTVPNVKYCTTCGASLNLAAEICPKCGVRQTAASPNMFLGSGGGSSRSMGFFESWITCLQKTFDYKSRASQSEFAYFTLSQIGIFFVLSFITHPVISTLVFISEILLLLPSISAYVRRFHDFDASGWFVLLTFVIVNMICIPIGLFFGFVSGIASFFGEEMKITAIGITLLFGIGFVVDLVIALIKGTEGANRYGA